MRIDTCDLDDAIEALAYWRTRRSRLPWHRRRDRAEAEAMVTRWEHRVRWALIDDQRATLGARVDGGVLVLRTFAGRLGRRWARRLAIVTFVGAALMGVFLMLVASALF